MRGPCSRSAAFALALVFGAAGAHALGTLSPTAATPCMATCSSAASVHTGAGPDAVRTVPAPLDAWRGADADPRGTGPDVESKARRDGHRSRSHSVARTSAPKPSPLVVPPSFVGLLGMSTPSPANAPPSR